ncbi:hypothetical protein D8674_005480 [Pyrus ussuriensis x Pyrus communis]|uniref:Uncharacterized protein n=1 Tax=Pyrus ussuriensis x Pyrus communis TaxID=2448454 RepID=A0A5N5FRX7_9ROSA|nr:hypothetical protein D8674_005480 [Pyrus ussuriensis x Pyrus communis]
MPVDRPSGLGHAWMIGGSDEERLELKVAKVVEDYNRVKRDSRELDNVFVASALLSYMVLAKEMEDLPYLGYMVKQAPSGLTHYYPIMADFFGFSLLKAEMVRCPTPTLAIIADSFTQHASSTHDVKKRLLRLKSTLDCNNARICVTWMGYLGSLEDDIPPNALTLVHAPTAAETSLRARDAPLEPPSVMQSQRAQN